jgi:sugar O-acyltransferase (sialic acid O-acetyltransferase NeuD family)
MTRTSLLILGARTFAREVADLLGDLPEFELKGFVENLDPELCSQRIDGLPVYWVDEVAAGGGAPAGRCALGSTQRTAFIENAAGQGLSFARLVHPSARVSSTSIVGEGSIVCPGVQIASRARIGRHVLINRGALIGHNVEIGDFATIGPGANIGGFSRIGAGTHVGMGAIVVDRIVVGDGSMVAAGAVVTREVAGNVMVAGMPAVVVQRGIDGL